MRYERLGETGARQREEKADEREEWRRRGDSVMRSKRQMKAVTGEEVTDTEWILLYSRSWRW